jgi:hypothetical protein
MYGLLMTVYLVFQKDDFEDERRWKRIAVILGACIPDEKRAELKGDITAEDGDFTMQVVGSILGKAFGNTVTLALGWAVHAFLT